MIRDGQTVADVKTESESTRRLGRVQIILIFLLSVLLRWCITYHPYSGQGKPPMFGDYEAQRHWQEITLNLPAEQWYINSTDNDLLYWGLDYPPLTAYHSFLLGHLANKINSSYIELHKSRGFSSNEHKYFMRLTVLCVDILVYMPAMIYFMSTVQPRNSYVGDSDLFGFDKRYIILLTSLMYPGLILIDYGHFQYNCVSLGLFIAAVAAILKNSLILGSFFFVAALNYKQMELYHALPIFFYLLAICTPKKRKYWLHSLTTLFYISLTVIATFILMWLPFLKNWNIFLNVVHRLFPIARGVFEDKVANVWCTINILYKLRNAFSNEQLAKICLAVTTIAVLPNCIDLYIKPSKQKFILSLINSALGFFLFSFQVHEKSILLVAIPVLLHFHNDPLPCFWFLIISHFSMLPLFIKDNLYISYVATMALYYFFVRFVWCALFCSTSTYDEQQKLFNNAAANKKKLKSKRIKNKSPTTKIKGNWLTYYQNIFSAILPKFNYNSCVLFAFYISVSGVIFLSAISYFLKSPQRYPDLYALLVSVYSCGHFIVFYLYFNYKQICVSGQIAQKHKPH